MVRRSSAIGLHRSESTTISASGEGEKEGGRLDGAWRSCTIACAILSITLRSAVGRISPGMPIRSPPSTSRWPSAKPITIARSSLVSETSGEANIMEGERSGQIHTVWAASHSRSRTYRWSSRAERRQSTRCAGSPETKRRYCQKFSPGPARRRPCSPWITVAATRRASRIRRGMAAVSERALAVARRVVSPSGELTDTSLGIRLSDAGPQTADHRLDGLAIGTGREAERHAVFQDGLRQIDDVVDRRREAALEQRARPHREHERLAGTRARSPRDQLGRLVAFGAGT